ncbi:hypothetical protein [Marivita cryptomonadis]|uniref:hypothetical protein n=1 Tax=Marivita cryptomonadis TaxID=505252 RepID=UPI00391CBFE9
MKSSTRKTRVEHFLEAFQSLNPDLLERIWDRIHRASWSADDPASVQIAHDTIMEEMLVNSLRRIEAVPETIQKMAEATSADIDRTYRQQRDRDMTAISSSVAAASSAVLQSELPKWERSYHWRTAARLFSSTALACVIALAVGYIVGREDTAGLSDEYAALAHQADAATWIRLQTLNFNLDNLISTHCRPGQPGHILTTTGQKACDLPLWIEALPAPRPVTTWARAADQVTSVSARMPFGFTLGIGILIGIAICLLRQRFID